MYIEGCLIEFVPFSPELKFHTVFLPFPFFFAAAATTEAATTVFFCVAVTLTKINTVKIAKYQTVFLIHFAFSFSF